MTEIEFKFKEKYGWYVVRFFDVLCGHSRHIPFRKLQDAKDYIGDHFTPRVAESQQTALQIEFCCYRNETDKHNDFPIGNRHPIWAGYLDGVACLGYVKEVKGLRR